MNFGEALELIKQGKAVSRTGWNGKGMYVLMERLYTPDNIQIDNRCLLLSNVIGTYNTWIPSITDLFAEDWNVFE